MLLDKGRIHFVGVIQRHVVQPKHQLWRPVVQSALSPQIVRCFRPIPLVDQMKSGAVVCNIGHFDNEIDTAFMRKHWEWEEIKPQVHKVYRDKASNDHLILLSEGRLVNLGNATGHPSRIMDGSFANQVLAQIYLFGQKSADQENRSITLEVLPKKLDEEVAEHMVRGFGGVITRLTDEQAKYINVKVEGPFKVEQYKY